MNTPKEKPFAYAMVIVYFIFHISIWASHGRIAIHSPHNTYLYTFTILWMFFTFYTIIAYFSAAFSDPGYLTEDWNKNNPTMKVDPDNKEEKLFCDKCNITRPPRAHHCKECNKCVLMMDHHCIFTSNCVGFRSLRPYFIFLISFPLDGIFSLLMMLNNLEKRDKNIFKTLVFAFSFIYFGLFLIVDFVQLYTLLINLINNSSEVENERDKSHKYEYDLVCIDQFPEYDTGSLFHNIQQKLGNNPLTWFIPFPRNDQPIICPKNPKYIPYSQVKLKKSD